MSQPATVDVALKVATVTSEVVVSASLQPVLNTTDATLGNAFSEQQIQNLPSEARNVPDLLSLQPGVTFLGRTDQDTGTQSKGNTSDGLAKRFYKRRPFGPGQYHARWYRRQ